MRPIILTLMLVAFQIPLFAAKMVSCHDGDTCRFKVEGQEVKVRFSGIDTPEKKQSYGKDARNYLVKLLEGKEAQLECPGKSFDRKVCKVIVEGKDIAAEMVKAGWAWDYPKYSKGAYKTLQTEAQKNKVGLWKDPHATSPYCFRMKRKGRKDCRVSANHYQP